MSRRSRRTSLKEEARVGGSRAWLPEEEEEEEGDETRFKYGSGASGLFTERVQLSTTDIFCPKMENIVLLSTVFRVYEKSMR